MINKMYEKIKEYMKENFSFIMFMLITICIMLWPVDYYILTGGGTIDIDKRVVVENAFEQEGSMNFAYVKEAKGTITSYLLSYIMPNWEREKVEDYKINEDEDVEDLNFRNALDLQLSQDYAISYAYKKSGKEVSITDTKFYVYYIDNDAKTTLKVGDELLEYDGIKIDDNDSFKEYINTKKVNDKISLTVLRDDKEKEVEATLFEEDKKLYCGILLMPLNEYETDPKVSLKFKDSESGPSGGLMLTLDIYNKLTEKDLTQGLKIVGTGTVDEEGNVGEIGGVLYKLRGAVDSDADVFLVPYGNNYVDSIKLAKKEDFDIKIIGVKTVDDAIEKLEKLEK